MTNSRSNSFEGDVRYEQKWGYLYDNDCEICKRNKMDVKQCNHRKICKIFVMKTEEGVVRTKQVNKNAKLPSRGTLGSADYGLAAAEITIVLAHGKCLVKTGLVMALPPDC